MNEMLNQLAEDVMVSPPARERMRDAGLLISDMNVIAASYIKPGLTVPITPENLSTLNKYVLLMMAPYTPRILLSQDDRNHINRIADEAKRAILRVIPREPTEAQSLRRLIESGAVR